MGKWIKPLVSLGLVIPAANVFAFSIDEGFRFHHVYSGHLLAVVAGIFFISLCIVSVTNEFREQDISKLAFFSIMLVVAMFILPFVVREKAHLLASFGTAAVVLLFSLFILKRRSASQLSRSTVSE